jgi:hypothetical protein
MTLRSDEQRTPSYYDVSQYLMSKNWEKLDQFSENGLIDTYRHEKYLLEVVVDETLPSYQDRLRQTIISLAHIENKKSEEIIKEIQNASLYTIRVKADTPAHRIRLDESIAMRTGIHRAYLASAHSTLYPAIDIKRMSAKDPNTLASLIYDDQTEAASYIANFRTPKTASTGGLKNENVIDKFKDAVLTIKEICNDDTIPGISQYEDLAKKGLSKQFLESLKMLNLKESQAKTLTVEIVGSSHESFTFEEKDFDLIEDFCNTLAQTSENEDTVEGTIVALSSQGVISDGEIRLSSVINGVTRIVRVKLKKEDYDQAAEHYSNTRKQSKQPLATVTGLLRIRRRSTEIVDVSKIIFLIQT